MEAVAVVPTARHLLRAKDLADARYFEPLPVADMAAAARAVACPLQPAIPETFGESRTNTC